MSLYSERKVTLVLLLVTLVSLLLLVVERWQKNQSDPHCETKVHSVVNTKVSSSPKGTEHFRDKYLLLVRDTVLGYSLRTREKSLIPSLNEQKTIGQFFSGCVSSLLKCDGKPKSKNSKTVLKESYEDEDQDNFSWEGQADMKTELKEYLSQLKGEDAFSCQVKFNQTMRKTGEDWPMIALTMIGQVRMDSLRKSVESVISNNIKGDWVECGVWRGGASIYAKALFDSLDHNNDRLVWLVDSFAGLPAPRSTKGYDTAKWSKLNYLRVPLDEVKENFRGLGLLDDSVRFCQGYFVDALPTCGCRRRRIAILRMDGDMYESTMDQLFNLYEQVVIGGHILIDDWKIRATSLAIHHFFAFHNVTEKFITLADGTAYFIKTNSFQVNMTHYKKW